MLAMAAAGCSGLSGLSETVKSDAGWFQAPLSLGSRSDGSAAVANKNFDLGPRGSVAPEDLVNPDGSCAAASMAAAPATDGVGQSQALPVEQPILGGIALGMSECDAVRRAGMPSNVNIGAGVAGDRNVVLTYLAGPWPGIYSFSSGRLKEISAAPVQAKPAAPKKKPVAATRPRATQPTQIR